VLKIATLPKINQIFSSNTKKTQTQAGLKTAMPALGAPE